MPAVAGGSVLAVTGRVVRKWLSRQSPRSVADQCLAADQSQGCAGDHAGLLPLNERMHTMKVLVALGGYAIFWRGQLLRLENQQANICRAAEQLARVVVAHERVLTHGNGPQVGLLALRTPACSAVEAYPLDVPGAQSQGMVGGLR